MEANDLRRKSIRDRRTIANNLVQDKVALPDAVSKSSKGRAVLGIKQTLLGATKAKEEPLTGPAKRIQPEQDTSNPSDNRQSKRKKFFAQDSAQAVKGLVRLTLVLENYPGKKLGAVECAELRRCILDLSEGIRTSIFTSSWKKMRQLFSHV